VNHLINPLSHKEQEKISKNKKEQKKSQRRKTNKEIKKMRK
jgi:hypothetical protein